MMFAIGVDLSADYDRAAIAAGGAGEGRYEVDVAWYGSPDDVVAQCARLYAELDPCGTFADPQACAGILDGLRAEGVWLHELEPLDVSAAQFQYLTEVHARRVKGGKHPALREAMRTAESRQRAVRFAFERRRVMADQAPLNAAAFALLGLRRNQAVSEPGAWVI